MNDEDRRRFDEAMTTLRQLAQQEVEFREHRSMTAWWLEMVRDHEATDRAWAVECSRACCGEGYRDGVGVAVPTQSWDDEFPADDRVPMRTVAIIAIDGHKDESNPVVIDVEDARQLVNILMEAIAHIDSRGPR